MLHANGTAVSVVLLTFNHQDVVASTIESIRNQSLDDYEIVISDDCSTDGTWDRVISVAADDSRVVAIRTPKNVGMAANANFAVSRTSRPYVALLHHDDLYRNDLLEKWSGVLDRHSDVHFVFNPYGRHHREGIDAVSMPGERVDGGWLLEKRLLSGWGCPVRGTAMIRRTSWNQANGMRVEYGLLADIDLWMRLAMMGAVGYVNEPLIAVRHARPSYYPKEYSGDEWSWKRLRLLYEVHAANQTQWYGKSTLTAKLRWLAFRARVSVETSKWIAYGLLRRRRAMLQSCEQSSTPYDLWPLGLIRKVAQGAAHLIPDKGV